jgi:2-oxoisovalerate dehydrogenase E1 component subunit beta
MAELRLIEAICEALHEEMERDDAVVLLGEDVGVKGGVFGASKGLLQKFGPLRVLDTPVSEIAIAGAAIGAAMMGLRPVAEFQFADYMHPAYDQIVSQAATIRWRSVGGFGVPAVFRAPFGGGVRGGVYHSQSMEAAYCNVPGLKVVVPATPADGKGLLKAAIRDDDPVVFFEPKRAYRLASEAVGGPDDVTPLGVARIDRTGTTLTIVTYGIGVHVARDAASTLSEGGIDVEIVDLRTLVPMDKATVAASVAKTGRLLVLHEANKTMGFGAEVAAFAAEELFYDLDAPIVRVAADDCHLPYNSPEEDAIIPLPSDVILAARALAAR